MGGHEHWRALGIKGDNVFFAGLLEGLAQWWDGLGWAGQVLITALGVMLIVMLIMVLGGSFALAMGATGVMAWGLSHRREGWPPWCATRGVLSWVTSPLSPRAGSVLTCWTC